MTWQSHLLTTQEQIRDLLNVHPVRDVREVLAIALT